MKYWTQISMPMTSSHSLQRILTLGSFNIHILSATAYMKLQVKVWSREGIAVSSSGHHHGAVECILAVSLPIFTVYTASSDGSVFKFTPDVETGKIEEGFGATIKVEAQAGRISPIAALSVGNYHNSLECFENRVFNLCQMVR